MIQQEEIERRSNLDAERQVIGSILMDNDALEKVCDTLKPEMFYDARLASAYRECLSAKADGRQIEIAYLSDRMKLETNFPEETIFEILKECALSTVTSVNIEAHAETIKATYAVRMVGMLGADKTITMDTVYDRIKALYDDVGSIGTISKDYETLAEVTDRYKDDYFTDNRKPTLNVGLKPFDDLTGGLEGGDVIVIGARPSVGKSALATQMVNHIANSGKKVGYFNLEMTGKQVFERFVAAESGIGLTRIRRALCFLNDEEEKYNQAIEKMRQKDRLIISTGSKTVSQMRAITKREQFDIIVVDYLQLVIPDSHYRGNRFAEVGRISHDLKAISTELDIPVIVLTQLNRESMKTQTKEPTMAEIRESGDIEQDASIIMLLWNTDEEDRSRKGYKIDKNRQGNLKKGELRFNGNLMKFYSDEDDDGFLPADDDFDIPFDI